METIFVEQDGATMHFFYKVLLWGPGANQLKQPIAICKDGIGPGGMSKQDGPLPHPSIHVCVSFLFLKTLFIYF